MYLEGLIPSIHMYYVIYIIQLLIFMVGHFDFQEMINYYGIWGGFYLLFYLMTMILLIVNIFIVILDTFMSAIKEDESVIPDDHVVLDHFMNIVKSFVVKKKPEPSTQTGMIKGI